MKQKIKSLISVVALSIVLIFNMQRISAQTSNKIDLSGKWEIDGKIWQLKIAKNVVSTNYLQNCSPEMFSQMVSGKYAIYCDSDSTQQVCAWVDSKNNFCVITSINAGAMVPTLFCTTVYDPTATELKGSCLFCNFGGKLIETPKGFNAKRIPK